HQTIFVAGSESGHLHVRRRRMIENFVQALVLERIKIDFPTGRAQMFGPGFDAYALTRRNAEDVGNQCGDALHRTAWRSRCRDANSSAAKSSAVSDSCSCAQATKLCTPS